MTYMGRGLSAMEVWEDLHKGVYGTSRTTDRQLVRTLFRDLYMAIQSDYAAKGRCDYIEMLFRNRVSQITAVEYSVLVSLTRDQRDVQAELDEGWYLPGVLFNDQGISWDYGLDVIPVSGLTGMLNSIHGKLSRRPEPSATEPAAGEARKPADAPRAQTADTGSTAQGETQSGFWKRPDAAANARKQADQILASAREQAEAIRRKAEQEAREIRAKAEQEIREAREQMDRDRESLNLRQAAADRQRAALEEKERELNERQRRLETGAEEETRRLETQYLRSYQSDLRAEWERETREGQNADAETFQALNEMKGELCDATNGLKVAWRKQMEETLEEIRSLQSGLDDRLRAWQTSLYTREMRPIADCYVQLYRIVTQDQLLTREILARDAEKKAAEKKEKETAEKAETAASPETAPTQTAETATEAAPVEQTEPADMSSVGEQADSSVQEDQQAAAPEITEDTRTDGTAPAAEEQQAPESPAPAEPEPLHEETLETLKKLNTSLLTFLRKFEKTMNRLGLHLCTPKPGDPYDDVLHLAPGDVEDPDGMVVARCVVPGVVRVSGGDLEDADPVIRAVVELKEPEEA